RVEKNGEVKVSTAKLGDIEYRVYDADDVKIAVAITSTQLIAAAAPESALEWVMGYALGQTQPEKSLVDAGTLTELAGRYGGKGKGLSLGYVDLLGIEKVLAGETKGLTAESLAKLGMPGAILEGDCATEFGVLASLMPRLVYAGYYE